MYRVVQAFLSVKVGGFDWYQKTDCLTIFSFTQFYLSKDTPDGSMIAATFHFDLALIIWVWNGRMNDWHASVVTLTLCKFGNCSNDWNYRDFLFKTDHIIVSAQLPRFHRWFLYSKAVLPLFWVLNQIRRTATRAVLWVARRLILSARLKFMSLFLQVEVLVERVRNATVLETRRDAVRALKSLSKVFSQVFLIKVILLIKIKLCLRNSDMKLALLPLMSLLMYCVMTGSYSSFNDNIIFFM